MDCVPELSVLKRKTLSSAKMIKRLRRFVLDNRPPESHSGQNGADASLGDEPNSAELVCRIPEETLFQLQQIYEALEAKGGRRTSAKPLGLPSSSLPPPRNADDAGPLQTPKKTPSKKRRREAEEPATENAKHRDNESREKRKNKKARRKSAST
eukprot:jgi/Undpi1/2577/HiC_scaffold_13.g05956.m1